MIGKEFQANATQRRPALLGRKHEVNLRDTHGNSAIKWT